MFVTSRNLLFGVFLTKKNSRKFQASVTERCISLSKSSGKSWKSWILKNFTAHELLQKWLLRFPEGFFSPIYLSTYLQRSLPVPYIAHILCIRIHICKRYYFPILLFLRWKAKEKYVLVFRLYLPLDWSIYLILYNYSINFLKYLL